jgi:hypothetical protein
MRIYSRVARECWRCILLLQGISTLVLFQGISTLDLQIYLPNFPCHSAKAIEGFMNASTIHACLYEPLFWLTPLALYEVPTNKKKHYIPLGVFQHQCF